MKLTPIFPAHIKPVRKGIYKVSSVATGLVELYAFWNGKWWSIACYDNHTAGQFKHDKSNHQNKRWQGVAR